MTNEKNTLERKRYDEQKRTREQMFFGIDLKSSKDNLELVERFEKIVELSNPALVYPRTDRPTSLVL